MSRRYIQTVKTAGYYVAGIYREKIFDQSELLRLIADLQTYDILEQHNWMSKGRFAYEKIKIVY